jgi:hypothetical protein
LQICDEHSYEFDCPDQFHLLHRVETIMAATVVNGGLELFLGWIFQTPRGATPQLGFRLFVNDLAYNEDTVFADLVEASYPGYGPVYLDPSFLTGPVIGGIGAQLQLNDPNRITFNAVVDSDLLYGYFVTLGSSSTLIWIDSIFPSGIIPAGQSLKISLDLELGEF